MRTSIVVYTLLVAVSIAANPITQPDHLKLQFRTQLSEVITTTSASSPKRSIRVKALPALSNGAFGPVNMIHKNAVNHKNYKKVEMGKIKPKKAAEAKPSALELCLSKPETTSVKTVVSGPKANTLFTSFNWGH